MRKRALWSILVAAAVAFGMSDVASNVTANHTSAVMIRSNSSEWEPRIYSMKKCHGAGCPYTASWLNHINLYRKAHWWLDSTKVACTIRRHFVKCTNAILV